MPADLTQVILSSDPQTRDLPLEHFLRDASPHAILAQCEVLDRFRRTSDNLYERVRALFFLYAIHRFHVPLRNDAATRSMIPFPGYAGLLKRRFEEAIDVFLAAQTGAGPSTAISSALAAGYRALG